MSHRFSHSSHLPHAPEEVFAWHAKPDALPRLMPPWVPVKLKSQEGIRDGERTHLRLGWEPLGLSWVAEHVDYSEGRMFTDVQVRGPFAEWKHRHVFEPSQGGCRLTDDISFDLPASAIGDLAVAWIMRSLRSQFSYRHTVTTNDLHLHHRYSRRPLRIAVSGSSGLIGKALTSFLRTGGHDVLPIVRRPAEQGEIYWNINEGSIDTDSLEGVDAVVHLAGENLMAPRWTKTKKQRIYDSRIHGTRLLAGALSGLRRPPSVFVSSSAIGIYGDRGSEIIDESSSLDESSFLARVCYDWEQACDPAREAGIRTVTLRTGIVISGAGGALAPMMPIFKLGLGGRFGDPATFMSWIALDDVIGAIFHSISTESVTGPVNVTAPAPLNWDQFATTVGKVMNRPTFVTIPTWITQMATGEMGRDVILSGARVLPQALLQSNYDFLFSDAESALRHQLGYPERADSAASS